MTPPKLILGTAQIDGSYGIRQAVDDAENSSQWFKILSSAAALGFSAIDTASGYPGAHEVIGASEWNGPIHTKIGNISDAEDEISRARTTLSRNQLEIVYFHESSVALTNRREAGLLAQKMLGDDIDAVGISIYSVEELDSVLDFPQISVIQLPLNLLDQRFLNGALDRARGAGKRIIVRSVFLQGLLLGEPEQLTRQIPDDLKIVVKKFLQTCADNSIHPTAACLSFVKSIQGIEGVVLGVESLDHAQQLSSLWSEIEPGDVDLTLFSGLKETDPKITDPRFWREEGLNDTK